MKEQGRFLSPIWVAIFVNFKHFAPFRCWFNFTGNSFYKNNREISHKALFEKYRASIDIYNVKVINEIIFNRPVRITSIFKDYLVHDEVAEFLKRSYPLEEIPAKMRRLVEFFNSYFKVFPNYINLGEKSFMYK